MEKNNEKQHAKCVTGFNPYGLCSCCRADGVICCIECGERHDCNISCGWLEKILEEIEE